MTGIEIGSWAFPVLLLLIFLRIPIGLAMLVCGIAGSWLLSGGTTMVMGQLKHQVYGTFSNYSLSIVPLFLLMGQFATMGGMSRGLFKAAETFLGHRRGGLAMSAIGACAGFGAICGSSLATASTMGQVALPELRRAGYAGPLATGTLAAGGTLGILIPPSVILVIYAILTEQNIAKLFVAAMVPGLLAAAGYMACIAILARVTTGAGRVLPRAGWSARGRALAETWPVIAIFVAVVGGIYAGIFTPTEAAAVGAAGTGLLAMVSGNLGLKDLRDALLATATGTAMIFLIVLGAAVFNGFLAFSQLPQTAAAWAGGLSVSPHVILLAVLLLYLAFGCVMDSLSMILLTVPIIYPVMTALDFGMSAEDFGLWFGILILIVVEVGLITPPVGMNLFVINQMAPDVPIGQTFRGTLPFVATDILRVAILVAAPVLTLGLVRMLY